MVYIFIILYVIFITFLFLLVIKRIKHLSRRQAENTGIKGLERGYKKTLRRLVVLYFFLVVIISLLFLTFLENDLLSKRWFYVTKETLDNNVF